MIVNINGNEFNFPWEKSITVNGWNEFKKWFDNQIDNGYNEDDEGNELYPYLIINTKLNKNIVKGIMYAHNIHYFGEVKENGDYQVLWYCAPQYEKMYEFMNSMRIAEHLIRKWKPVIL